MERLNELKAKKDSKSDAEAKLQSTIISSLRAENAKALRRFKELKAEKNNKSDEEAKLHSKINSLRANKTKILKRLNELERQQKNKSKAEATLQSKIYKLRAEHTKALRRLNETVEQISKLHAEQAGGLEIISKLGIANKTLKSELDAANAKVEMLQIEVHLINQRHNIPDLKTSR